MAARARSDPCRVTESRRTAGRSPALLSRRPGGELTTRAPGHQGTKAPRPIAPVDVFTSAENRKFLPQVWFHVRS